MQWRGNRGQAMVEYLMISGLITVAAIMLLKTMYPDLQSILQELAGLPSRGAAVVATAATCAVPLAFLLAAGQGSYMTYWTLFGTSNQLLASLSLLGITVWLRKQRKPIWYTVAPMLLVMSVTVVALALQARTLVDAAAGSTPWINGLVLAVLLVLAGALVIYAVRAWRDPDAQAP